uniref:hypothetical protein n=1 Tax=Paractinoplanes polyasparticus TaxID=2856853 RepID=UPI001C841658|nr:hypothetical protein [Actinoplanes polyasparticus]
MTDDDDLRARLRRADPAADLPTLDTSRLLESTMTATTTTPRRTIPLLTLAAALVLIAALGSWWVLRPADEAGAPTAAPTVTDLTAPGIAAKCVEPSAGQLREAADFAFAGTVTGIDGTTVTLRVTKVYRGAGADQVRVAQAGDVSETMLGSGRFEIGRDYLVAASQGSVLICGYSGEAASPGLEELYLSAF